MDVCGISFSVNWMLWCYWRIANSTNLKQVPLFIFYTRMSPSNIKRTQCVVIPRPWEWSSEQTKSVTCNNWPVGSVPQYRATQPIGRSLQGISRWGQVNRSLRLQRQIGEAWLQHTVIEAWLLLILQRVLFSTSHWTSTVSRHERVYKVRMSQYKTVWCSRYLFRANAAAR